MHASIGYLKYPITATYIADVFEFKCLLYNSSDQLVATLTTDRYNMVFGTYERHSTSQEFACSDNSKLKFSIASSVVKSGDRRAVYMSPFMNAYWIRP